MREAGAPWNEEERIHALHRYRILDTDPDTAFDELAALAAQICEAPIALVSLVDESRQWFKAVVGLDTRETARSVAFCAHAILQEGLFVVGNALEDERFADNPLVTGPPNIRFYAGAPLINDDGYGLGTLCVIDDKPRQLTEMQSTALMVLRRHVLALMEMRRRNLDLRALNHDLDTMMATLSRELWAPVRRIDSFAQALEEDCDTQLDAAGKDHLLRIRNNAQAMREVIENVSSLAHLAHAGINVIKVNVSDIAANIISNLKRGAPRRNVEVSIQPDVTLYADANLVKVVMENLLSNAWKFTSKRDLARIEVGTAKKDGEIMVYVRDNGVGFEMARADAMFIPFQRLHPQSDFPGMGVGLATVQQIVHRHGGEVLVEGAPDKGATFYFVM